MSKAILILITAPSGAGKSTLCDRLLSEFENITYSVSCTTRMPRGEEEDGVDYFFVTEESFERNVAEDRFLEHAEVHGNMYGTLKDTVREAIMEGSSVLMDIDVQGARQIREELADLPDDDPLKAGYVDIFISPPSIDTLRERLYGRGEDNEEEIERRLNNAALEMAGKDEFRFVILNDDLDVAYKELREIVEMVTL
ncbi:guanylate kinase [bacterium E08(2017)]|nr:guanylate kinase [bacterium E08(2017)]